MIVMQHTLVAIPIYLRKLPALEEFSLDVSLARLQPHRPRCFIGPRGLDMGYYRERYPGIELVAFEPEHFASVKGYSRLLLDPAFYQRFAEHTFTLMLQTDAVLLSDELDHWAQRPFDYIGAPWPVGLELRIAVDRFADVGGQVVRAQVGNGGLSLRRNMACIALLEEFPQARAVFSATGSNEDLFFALLGQLSRQFLLPNPIEASTFALELDPSRYLQINGGRLPLGGHAWWRYDLPFWTKLLPDLPDLPALQQALIRSRALPL